MAYVRLEDVSFWYPVYDITGRSLKVSMMRQFGGQRSENPGVVEVNALSQVSFELNDGDRLGLIGRNGAGKSTLLRMLAGLIYPRQGGIKIRGRVTPLIARGLGIHPELSGFQNIELPMRLLGAKEKEIREAKREIPEWSGLGDFIHLPVRTYSDGMRARLLFAICTAVRGDILVMDEWLSAGDADFVEKAATRMEELVSTSGIVVLSSHSLDLVRRFCNLICWMDRGQIVMMGDPDTVIPAYLRGIQRPNAEPDRRITGLG
ncbi:MAG TPA: ABC transporter ATP-binding protein [Caulobacterales bacterium]|nr:ABC transporter ATP-binding protein [Caulobacterales bacterium]